MLPALAALIPAFTLESVTVAATVSGFFAFLWKKNEDGSISHDFDFSSYDNSIERLPAEYTNFDTELKRYSDISALGIKDYMTDLSFLVPPAQVVKETNTSQSISTQTSLLSVAKSSNIESIEQQKILNNNISALNTTLTKMFEAKTLELVKITESNVILSENLKALNFSLASLPKVIADGTTYQLQMQSSILGELQNLSDVTHNQKLTYQAGAVNVTTPSPVVNVSPPNVTVNPQITVQPSDVNVSPANVSLSPNINIDTKPIADATTAIVSAQTVANEKIANSISSQAIAHSASSAKISESITAQAIAHSASSAKISESITAQATAHSASSAKISESITAQATAHSVSSEKIAESITAQTETNLSQSKSITEQSSLIERLSDRDFNFKSDQYIQTDKLIAATKNQTIKMDGGLSVNVDVTPLAQANNIIASGVENQIQTNAKIVESITKKNEHLDYLKNGHEQLKDSEGNKIIPREIQAKKDAEVHIDKESLNKTTIEEIMEFNQDIREFLDGNSVEAVFSDALGATSGFVDNLNPLKAILQHVLNSHEKEHNPEYQPPKEGA